MSCFQRLLELAIHGTGDDFRLPHGHFITFAPHHLNQDGQLKFAPAHHLEGIVTAHILHADGHVGEQFLVEPVAQVPRGHERAIPPREGRGVDR